MDILRLDPNTFQPVELVEGYTSMIWTERYIGAGEFEYRTANIFATLDVLQEGAFISLRDSAEVMMVETRSIDVDEDGNMELVVTGRTLETFLEHRILVPTVHGVTWSTNKRYNVTDACLLLLWNHLINNTGWDPTRVDWPMDPYTAIPNIVTTETHGSKSSPDNLHGKWWLDGGQVYPTFQSWLALGELGVRCIRPRNTSATVVTFRVDSPLVWGTALHTSRTNIQELRLDVYTADDRSMYQSARKPVIFHYDSGHLENTKYLFSDKEYKNVAFVISSLWAQVVVPPNVSSDISGINRRVLYVDAGVSDVNDPESETLLIQKGAVELRKYALVRMFDGEISPVSPYVYGKDYFLGDTVTLLGQFGFEKQMLVSEYTRTEDREGERGYPGLSDLPV